MGAFITSLLTKKMAIGYVCHLESGRVNAYDEFTNYKSLSDEQKSKMLLGNDEVVAKSFYKILENIIYNKIGEKK